MKESNDLSSFLDSLERNELNEEQQVLLSSYGGSDITITVDIGNILAGCITNNCKGGNCGNCVSGCSN